MTVHPSRHPRSEPPFGQRPQNPDSPGEGNDSCPTTGNVVDHQEKSLRGLQNEILVLNLWVARNRRMCPSPRGPSRARPPGPVPRRMTMARGTANLVSRASATGRQLNARLQTGLQQLPA